MKTITIPCIFSGIFYIEALSTNRQLQCRFKPDDNFIRCLTLTHFQAPQKRKARGIFNEDDMSTEVIVRQDQTQQQPVLLLFIFVDTALNLRTKIIRLSLLRQGVIVLEMTIKVLMFSILNNK